MIAIHAALWWVLSATAAEGVAPAEAADMAPPVPATYEAIFGKPSRHVPGGVPLLADPVVGFSMDKLDAYSVNELLQQAEFHWAYYELEEADAIVDELLRRDPANGEYAWRKGRLMYDRGEELPEEDRDRRLQHWDEMARITRECRERDSSIIGCAFFHGVAIGRASTTRGLLNSLFAAGDVEEAWLKTLEMKDSYSNRRHEGFHTWAHLALGIFYRLVPDVWLLEVLAGTRGDKEKAVQHLRRGIELTPNRMDTHKELGVALICLGWDEDREELIAEGRLELEQVAAGVWRDYRNTDEVDMRHARMLLKETPKKVCGYSRDGFQEIDEDKIKERAEN